MDIQTHGLPERETGEAVYFLNRIVGKERLSDEPMHMPFSVGIHPWYIEGDGRAQLEALWKVARLPEVWLIGEAGLDKNSPDLPLQQTLFETQALLAEELRKPLVVHCVRAWQELLGSYRKLHPLSAWIIHGFRGKRALAEQLLNVGFYLSFGAHFQAEALQAAYPHRFFLETDESPLPIQTIYQHAADSLSLPVEEVAEQAERNWEKLTMI